VAGRAFGRLTNDELGAVVFALPDRGRDAVDIEAVRPAEVLSDPVQLINDRVASFGQLGSLPSGDPGLAGKKRRFSEA
jgi:hypothetical protein